MDYYGKSRRERRAGMHRKCKIKYGKSRGLDDKGRRRKIPNPDPDHVATVDELIDAFANDNIYEEEWDALLHEGVINKQEYLIGVDEKLAREALDDEEDEEEFWHVAQGASTMPVDIEDGAFNRDELKDLGFMSGYLPGTLEDDLYVDYITGQLPYQELASYLNTANIERWLFDKSVRDRQDYVVMRMPVKPTRISHTSGGKTLYEWKDKKPGDRWMPEQTVSAETRKEGKSFKSKRNKLKALGFESGYSEGTFEDDVFVDYVSGDMAVGDLWENVRDGLPASLAWLYIDTYKDYQIVLKQEEDRKKFEKERMLLYNQQQAAAAARRARELEKDITRALHGEPTEFISSAKPDALLEQNRLLEQKRIKKAIRKAARNGTKSKNGVDNFDYFEDFPMDTDDSTSCKGN
jgi:hypothetical protein